MTKPVIDVHVPADEEIVGEGAERIRETRQALYDVFPINPSDLDYEDTANWWPAGSLTGGMDPAVDNENPPVSDQFQDRAFLIGDKTLRWDYSIPDEHNAITPGPLDTGQATVTVPEGSTWTVVGEEDLTVQYLRDLDDVDVEDSISGDALIYDHTSDSWYAQPAPRGPQGPQGAEGPQGVQGDQGIQGIRGNQGDAGQQGHDGIQGPQGQTGPQGPQGIQGQEGQPGGGIQFQGTVATSTDIPGWPNSYVGAVGDAYMAEDTMIVWGWGANGVWNNMGKIVGPDGPQGVQGPQGIQGIQGDTGAQGIDGPQGPTGSQGPQGDEGQKGETGSQGTDGAKGEPGERGPEGEPGTPGIDYQYELKTDTSNAPRVILDSLTGGTQTDVQFFAGAGVVLSGIEGSGISIAAIPTPTFVRGMISMWGWNSSASVLATLNSENWFLCDGGSNAQSYGRGDYADCPDMEGYFTRGGEWGSDIATTGGSTSTGGRTLTIDTMPAHDHYATTGDAGQHAHVVNTQVAGTTYEAGAGSAVVVRGANFVDRDTTTIGNHSHSALAHANGGGGSHNHGLNPVHFTVAHIIYLGVEE